MSFLRKTKEEKDEKMKKEVEKFMKKYHLEDVDEEDLPILQGIALDLSGMGAAKVAAAFSNSVQGYSLFYLSAIFRENLLIIRKLEEINKNLEGKKE